MWNSTFCQSTADVGISSIPGWLFFSQNNLLSFLLGSGHTIKGEQSRWVQLRWSSSPDNNSSLWPGPPVTATIPAAEITISNVTIASISRGAYVSTQLGLVNNILRAAAAAAAAAAGWSRDTSERYCDRMFLYAGLF